MPVPGFETPFDQSGVPKYGSQDYFSQLGDTYAKSTQPALDAGKARIMTLMGGSGGFGTPALNTYAKQVEAPYQANLAKFMGGEIGGASKFFGQQLPFAEAGLTGQYGGQDTLAKGELTGQLGDVETFAMQMFNKKYTDMTPYEQGQVNAAQASAQAQKDAANAEFWKNIVNAIPGISGMIGGWLPKTPSLPTAPVIPGGGAVPGAGGYA